MQERWPNERHGIEYQGAVAKAPPCPESALRTPLPEESSSSTKEEESRWVLMEDRRRQSFAFENVAKEMLRYLENREELKVGITELQEQLEVPVQIGITLQQVAQQARNESLLARRRVMYSQLGKVERAVENLVELERRKDKKCSNMRSKARSECKPERVKDCRTKSVKK